jgi:glycosyltransferase involved in cell wall biosynthesis
MLDVSVAICTWNRRPLLEQTFAGLEKLRVGAIRWELIVVDNGSTDGTAELVKEWIERGTLPLRYVYEPTLGVSHARNRALREARADWLLFTDDDVIVDPCWLAAFVAATHKYPAAGAIGGRVDPWFVQPPDPEMCEAFPALAKGFCGLNLGSEDCVVPHGTFLVGANFGIRVDRSANRSFNPDLGPKGSNPVGGDENAFQMDLRAAGLDVLWDPKMRVTHYVDPKRMTVEYLRRFYKNVGRHTIILNGVPPGTRVAGVPRWLFRRYMDHSVNGFANRLRRNRVAALDAVRQRCLIGGMIAECWRPSANR